MTTAAPLTKQQLFTVSIPSNYMHPETGRVRVRMNTGEVIDRLPVDARELIALGRATLVRPDWIPGDIDTIPESFIAEPPKASQSKGR